MEIAAHGDWTVIHDRKFNKYYKVSVEQLAAITDWQDYRPRVTHLGFLAVLISFAALLLVDYGWFFLQGARGVENLRLWDWLLLWIFLLGNVGVHEAAHIWALNFCGRHPDRMGFKLNYWIFPAFYVRMNQVLLLSRRERLFCHLAGLYANALVIFFVVLAIFLDLPFAGQFATPAFIFLTMLVMNMLPALNSDGQKILATSLNQFETVSWSGASVLVRGIRIFSTLLALLITITAIRSVV